MRVIKPIETKLSPESETFLLASDNLVFVDCDETLAFWRTNEDPEDEIILVRDPYSAAGQDLIPMVPHHRNIALIKRNYYQGRTVIVWSAAGSLWAESIVKTLQLEDYVSLIMSKPTIYIDDLPIEKWGLSRVYLSKDLPRHPIKHKPIKKK